MPTLHPDVVWRLATEQWADISAQTPDLRPALGLQRRLVRLMLDAASALDQVSQGALATLTASSTHDKWRRGLPALRNEAIAIPSGLKDILPPLCTALAEGGAGDSAVHIRDAITGHSIDAESLLRVSLARNQKAIRTSALHMGLSPDLVWLIGELGSAPLANRLATTMDDGRSTIDDSWNRGYCPLCGSWPAFIEGMSGDLVLRCSYCALGWSLTPHRCVYCGNADDTFVSAAPDLAHPARRVELCGRCSGYTKVIDVGEPTPFPLLAIADLATIDLDQGSMDRGYRRPELFDLDTIEPRTSMC